MAAPQCYARLSRIEVIDRVLALLTFDTDGSGCDEAMGLMRWNHITSEELSVRRASHSPPPPT